MTGADLIDPSTHIQLTRAFLDAELRLDRLLALTHGRAAAGSAALQLVLPVVAKVPRTHWELLARPGSPPMPVGDMGDWLGGTLAALEPWAPGSIEGVFESACRAFEASRQEMHTLVSVLVLGEPTPLPLAEVLEVMGREKVLARLRASTQAFKSMQMVG